MKLLGWLASIPSAVAQRITRWRGDKLLRRLGIEPWHPGKAFSEENLKKARNELIEWRERARFDYRGRPLPAPLCSCGRELQPWPAGDTYSIEGIWAADLLDSVAFRSDWPTSHDVYELNGGILLKGICGDPQPPTPEQVRRMRNWLTDTRGTKAAPVELKEIPDETRESGS